MPELANVLDELERVLLDVAHAPGEISGPQLLAIQQRIEGRTDFYLRCVW